MEGKVIEPKEELEEEELEEPNLDEDEPQDKLPKETTEGSEEIVKPKVGVILNYTREVDTYVIDEEGNELLCNEENKDMVQAKTLSLLFEIKQMLKKKKNE